MLSTDLKDFLIEWNNVFSLDRWWREKYNVPFGSKQHLDANQLDILCEYIETKAFDDWKIVTLENITKKDRYKKDGWISENEVPEKVSDDEFNNINIEI